MGLGATHTFGLAEARERARKVRQQLADGIDPLAERLERRAASQGVLFASVAEMYVAAHSPSWRSPIHTQQWTSTLRVMGEMPVTAVDTSAVMQALEPIWHSKPETASRVRGRIESILDFASARGWRTGDNPARWKGHLDNLLPARASVAATRHHAALDWQAMPEMMASLSTRRGLAALALRFCILTAVRSGEARGARWSEIDMDNAVWAIPPRRMKAGAEHRVPLSDAALALLREVAPLRPDPAEDGFVFPGADAVKPLSDVALSKLLPSAVTVHGMRSAFRDWAGEATAHPREVVEMALAHRLGDKAEQAYARGGKSSDEGDESVQRYFRVRIIRRILASKSV